MGRSRRTSDNFVLFVLFCKLIMQGTAASFLSYPVVLLYLLVNDPVLLSRHDEVWVGSGCAPLAALWAVLRHKRVPLSAPWIVIRCGLLLLLSGVVTARVLIPPGEMTAAGLTVADMNPLRTGAVLVLLWVWIIAWRLIDRRWPAKRATRPGTRADQTRPGTRSVRRRQRVKPARGEIWSGLVPYAEGSYYEGEQDAKDRPCLVVSTFTRHAYVLKITTTDRSERTDHIELPAGWHPWSDKTSWLQLRPLLKVPHRDFRQHITTCPERLWARIDRMYPPEATTTSGATKTDSTPTKPTHRPDPRRARHRRDGQRHSEKVR